MAHLGAMSKTLLGIGLAAALATVIVMSTAQFAQAAGGVIGNLGGSVVEARTGAPISGASITAVSPSGAFRATSDARGFFAILQIPTDTYTLTVSKSGFLPQTISGVTVLGDQSQSVGIIRLSSEARTIGKVSVVAHTASSAFQPSQTVDETTFSGRRVDQALGEKGSTNFNQLVLSAPGVIETAAGSNSAFSIRGSASTEIGYQFDGVDFRGAFFDENPNQGFLNGVGGGRGGLQVVSGAGDATQGGIGAGVVNIIPGRGSYPGSGFVSFDVGSPWYDHALAFQYGLASPDGHFSDFLSTRSERSAPQVAPYGRSAADAGQYLGTSFTYDDDVLNNAYFRFGKNGDQQLQVLSDFLDHRSWAEYGGLNVAGYYPFDPYSYQQFQQDGNGNNMWPNTPNDPSGLQWYDSIIPYLPGTPHGNIPLTQPEEYIYGPTSFLKIGYTRSFGPTTALNTFFYNWGGLVANNITGNSSDLTTGSSLPGYNNAGGQRVGFQAELTKEAGEKHTLTFIAKFENGRPYWVQQNHGNTWQGLIVGRGQDQTNISNGGVVASNEPRIEDWFLPEFPGQPTTGAGGSNPCIGPAIDNNFNSSAGTAMGCYIYSWMLANGKWHGRLPAMPTMGWNYGNTDFQQFGIGFRDQWQPNAKLHIDYGVRVDGQNLKWGRNPFSADLGNPSDVGLGFAKLSSSYLEPRFFQPRFAIDYVLNPNNSVRLSYGRSVSFQFGQTGGTPAAAGNINPIYFQIPAKDTVGPGASLGPACGSGWHGPGKNGNGQYFQNGNVYFSGQGTLGQNGWYFLCPNYMESLFWTFDQGFSAPDIGGSFPPTYNNWDLAWEHQFGAGWGSKLTAYARRGYNTYQTTLLNAGQPNPVTGQETAGSFQERETGLQKAFGLEAMVTTPDRATGFTGFATLDYINELTDTPPVAGSDSLPIVQQYLYQSGTLFHQSYLPPISGRIGVDYKTQSGWRVNPIISFDGGEPFGVGTDAIGYINGVLYHLPTCNLGICTPYAGPGLPNQSYNSTCYLDPAFPGNYMNPNYFACRGNNEPSLAGQEYTRPRAYADLDLEYEHKLMTVGMYVTNLFNNYRAEPTINNAWQPVTTGVGGAQTGQYPNVYPLNPDGTVNSVYAAGGRNQSAYDEFWLPYQRLYVPGITFRFYVQYKL
jgi:hypothetical protein